jgi:hypothetical protein
VRHEIDPAPIRRNNLPSLVTFLLVIKIGVLPVGLISALRLPAQPMPSAAKIFDDP